MKILISNDDGVHAPGLVYLADALGKIADITVVAPDRNRSGVSNSLTLEHPLRVVTAANGFFSVNGTPTDCVHLAVTGLLKEMPDMVVSGINEGSNLSDDVLYSGTVAAATEGRFLGLPSMAISLSGPRCEHYDTAARIAKIMVERLKEQPLTFDTILNVNVPDVPFSELHGIQVTRLGTRHIAEPTIKDVDPRGRKIYWVGQPGPEQDAGPGTDFYAVNSGYVSVTPLHLDLTHYKVMEELSWVDNLNASRIIGTLRLYLGYCAIILVLAGCASEGNFAPVVDIETIQSIPINHRYRVEVNDTLYAIAWRYGLDFRTLAHLNHIRPPYHVRVGQVLYLESSTEKKEGSIKSVEKKLPIEKKLPKPAQIKAEQRRISSRWCWPTPGKLIKPYSKFNKGINIGGCRYQPIYAAADGIVVYAGNGLRGYGNLIILKHDDLYLSAYAHNELIMVKEGQRVMRGQQIAEMGSTGTNKTMLHFEIRRAGAPVNPILLYRRNR